MADPVVIGCPVDAWTKVATNATTGVIHILKDDPSAYYQTYRATGNPAPSDLSDAVSFKESLIISSSTGIDVYVRPAGKAGSVRADL